METTMVTIMGVITTIVTFIFGLISKKVTWFDDDLIPLQNLTIGLISGIICAFLNIDNMNMLTAIITCISASMAAGGLYDIQKSNK